MEYVEGESLSARLHRGRLPTDHVLAFGRQLVSALAAAHAKGIVHRDLKPGNIQVTPAGLVKVLDFGIASATRDLPGAASGATTTPAVEPAAPIRGVHPGTPPYMSPEQLLGRAVDEQSDIYSLGVVLFEMCTGRRPYPEKEAGGSLGPPATPAGYGAAFDCSQAEPTSVERTTSGFLPRRSKA
jgi:eukaryotic-like serine/threonine-protein kinase